jgi:antitoxin component of MazEF toxin-antitoxin module
MDMEIRLKLRKVGNSLMIAIPSQIVKDLKLKAGDDMLFDIIDSTISVKKSRRKEVKLVREVQRGRWTSNVC